MKLLALLADIIIYVLFVVGSIHSITWMLNISLFLYWVLAICIILVLFMNDDDIFKYDTGFSWFSVVKWLIHTLTVVGFGHFVLGSILFVCGGINMARTYRYFN